MDITIPTNWAMYKKSGDTKVRNLAKRAVEQMERAVEKCDKKLAKKVLVRFLVNWRRLASKKGTEEATDTAVREVVGDFHDKLAVASGFWGEWDTFDLWEKHSDESWGIVDKVTEVLDDLLQKECFAGEFCGCYEGDIDRVYPEGCKSLVERFRERLKAEAKS